jgi:Surface adhesin CshA non-repetitive domain 2
VRALIGVAAILATIAVVTTAALASASAATSVQCGYGTGATQAATLCWLDMSAYNFAQSSTVAGQPMTVSLPGVHDRLHRHDPGQPRATVQLAAPSGVSDLGGAYNGNHAYTATPGKPALYQTTNGGGDVVTLTNITVTDSTGTPVSGYGFVVADAESTDTGESTTYSSNVPLKQISASTAQFPYCGQGLAGVGTTTATCVGGQTGGTSDGAIVLQADTPTQISAALVGSGLQAVAFAIVTSKLTLAKAVVGRVKTTDSFDLAATSPEGTVIGAASTGAANAASTGALTVLPRTNGAAYTLS